MSSEGIYFYNEGGGGSKGQNGNNTCTKPLAVFRMYVMFWFAGTFLQPSPAPVNAMSPSTWPGSPPLVQGSPHPAKQRFHLYF